MPVVKYFSLNIAQQEKMQHILIGTRIYTGMKYYYFPAQLSAISIICFNSFVELHCHFNYRGEFYPDMIFTISKNT